MLKNDAKKVPSALKNDAEGCDAVALISTSSSSSSFGHTVGYFHLNAAGHLSYSLHINIERLPLHDTKTSDLNKRYSICTCAASLLAFT